MCGRALWRVDPSRMKRAGQGVTSGKHGVILGLLYGGMEDGNGRILDMILSRDLEVR